MQSLSSRLRIILSLRFPRQNDDAIKSVPFNVRLIAACDMIDGPITKEDHGMPWTKTFATDASGRDRKPEN
jgi:hypothetical protein